MPVSTRKVGNKVEIAEAICNKAYADPHSVSPGTMYDTREQLFAMNDPKVKPLLASFNSWILAFGQ